ncbi:hypothetical protein [Acetobacter thailandicus]|uniref:Transposase n=1 Tax=Acetobacter thailandicus TaxID=1502842 RepID=A0ABT3QCS8_9PROT|nr:hypothetical protein [Acetobacter thailandicus]MBS0986035.1 hypothetical protein [Acetobacter thailandicus]MCX2563070.1 hypothetical protein [Acetobacter thailandicus]NHN95788.1 hypothetical protein [Acetobacter thailandicus]
MRVSEPALCAQALLVWFLVTLPAPPELFLYSVSSIVHYVRLCVRLKEAGFVLAPDG